METLLKDLRYGIRSLLKQPAFALVAIGTLALAIGGNTAMFTVVNAVLLRPLPYPEPDRIVTLEGINPTRGINQSNVSVPDFADWQSQNQVFEQMAGFVTGGLVLNNGDETERVRGAWVTGDFFPLLRSKPLRGRTLQAEDAQPRPHVPFRLANDFYVADMASLKVSRVSRPLYERMLEARQLASHGLAAEAASLLRGIHASTALDVRSVF